MFSIYPSPGSLHPPAEHHRAHRLQEDGQVQEEPDVFDVIEVELEFLRGGSQGQAVWIHHLGPAGNARFYQEAIMVVADVVHRTVVGQRAGADKTHLAFQDIEELRQFVQAQFPDKPADPGYPGVVVCGPQRAALGGIFHHGPEFQDFENLALVA